MLSLEEGHDEEVTSLPPPRAKVRPHSTEGVLEDDVFSAERRRHMSAPVVPLSLTTKVYDVRDVHAAIRSQRERNWQLSRLNSEMQQELSDIMEERIALEIQLEHLNPFRF
ncbi:PREDICTED: ralBP1-associated Eps domain-containing protein 1-like [Priapulus caudatus]|uniref:RalBP1-associated Eps domain-containing protein 1-like n=1 Tax=Priapulus caudatus TaxID=37621 RepID=A0ABM1F7G9_PRICU|nr:PREDICTED: ralBP1-associated Eps domain-containing protein 1-like [Priapulus caudatus]